MEIFNYVRFIGESVLYIILVESKVVTNPPV